MWQYTVKRLLLMISTLIGAALVIFLLLNIIPGVVALLIIGGDHGGDLYACVRFLVMNISPGDVALLIIGGDQGGDINPRELAKLRGQLGLDRPLYEQFLSWLWCVD